MRKLILSLLCLLTAIATAAQAEPLKIKIGWITVPTSLAPILFAKPELAVHHGKSYEIEPVHFAGTAPMITALGSGELDIAELAFASFGLAIQNGHMTDIRVVASSLQDGYPGYLANAFLVLKDGPIKTIPDLKGKTIGTNVIGAGTDIAMRAYLRKFGLEDKRDYTVIEADFFHLIPLLTEGKADMVTSIANIRWTPQAQAVTRPLFTVSDAMGGSVQILFRVARAPYIEKNRAALVDYFEDEMRELRWYLDPKNRAEALQIISDFTKIPVAAMQGWLFTDKDLYRDPNLLPDLDRLAANLQTQREAGFLKAQIDVAKFADLSMVREAAQRISSSAAK
jgi:sulfonate transport system substrate-binding protein